MGIWTVDPAAGQCETTHSSKCLKISHWTQRYCASTSPVLPRSLTVRFFPVSTAEKKAKRMATWEYQGYSSGCNDGAHRHSPAAFRTSRNTGNSVLKVEGTTSNGTGSISCEVEFCIFRRLSLRTLWTKDEHVPHAVALRKCNLFTWCIYVYCMILTKMLLPLTPLRSWSFHGGKMSYLWGRIEILYIICMNVSLHRVTFHMLVLSKVLKTKCTHKQFYMWCQVIKQILKSLNNEGTHFLQHTSKGTIPLVKNKL